MSTAPGIIVDRGTMVVSSVPVTHIACAPTKPPMASSSRSSTSGGCSNGDRNFSRPDTRAGNHTRHHQHRNHFPQSQLQSFTARGDTEFTTPRYQTGSESARAAPMGAWTSSQTPPKHSHIQTVHLASRPNTPAQKRAAAELEQTLAEIRELD